MFPREKQLSIIASAYDSPGENSGFNKLPELDLANGANFYQARDEKVESLLNTPSRDLSTEQKEYWSNMSSKVETPLQYGYHEGWEIIMSSFELLMFALLAVCIVIAPVFSGEYQAGTDAVILSGKYGKTKLVTAKIISSILFGVLVFTLHVIVAFGLPLAAFGADGWNLPLQVACLFFMLCLGREDGGKLIVPVEQAVPVPGFLTVDPLAEQFIFHQCQWQFCFSLPADPLRHINPNPIRF